MHQRRKKLENSFLILSAGLIVFGGGHPHVGAQEMPSNALEIIVEGKRYDSLKAYRREHIKKVLLRALASENLQDFTEDDLCELILEVRRLQTTSAPFSQKTPKQTNSQTITKDAHDLDPSQMQEMLDEYLKEHKGTPPVTLDPDKVKNIIIQPKKKP